MTRLDSSSTGFTFPKARSRKKLGRNSNFSESEKRKFANKLKKENLIKMLKYPHHIKGGTIDKA